jgi:signal transduction histidine kinase
MLPRRSEEAMRILDGALTRADQAIAESRDAIQGLRSVPVAPIDLADLLTAMGQELGDSPEANRDAPDFCVKVEGQRQTLSPTLQNEVYQIGREALRNAFQHADAHHIDAEILYDERLLRLCIRDDGKGIAPKVLEQGGRAGHWGLIGIRERARRLGAQLDFRSEIGAGTEVQLTVPASIAYEPSPAPSHGLCRGLDSQFEPDGLGHGH